MSEPPQISREEIARIRARAEKTMRVYRLADSTSPMIEEAEGTLMLVAALEAAQRDRDQWYRTSAEDNATANRYHEECIRLRHELRTLKALVRDVLSLILELLTPWRYPPPSEEVESFRQAFWPWYWGKHQMRASRPTALSTLLSALDKWVAEEDPAHPRVDPPRRKPPTVRSRQAQQMLRDVVEVLRSGGVSLVIEERDQDTPGGE